MILDKSISIEDLENVFHNTKDLWKPIRGEVERKYLTSVNTLSSTLKDNTYCVSIQKLKTLANEYEHVILQSISHIDDGFKLNVSQTARTVPNVSHSGRKNGRREEILRYESPGFDIVRTSAGLPPNYAKQLRHVDEMTCCTDLRLFNSCSIIVNISPELRLFEIFNEATENFEILKIQPGSMLQFSHSLLHRGLGNDNKHTPLYALFAHSDSIEIEKPLRGTM